MLQTGRNKHNATHAMQQTQGFKLNATLAVQVHKAFEYLSKSTDVDQPDVRYEVKARRNDSMTTQRGILMREPMDSIKPVTFMCEVQPTLHEVRPNNLQSTRFCQMHLT